MKKVIHIVYDEKFIDATISFFDDVGTENCFYCIVPTEKFELQYIKKKDRVVCIIEADLWNLINSREKYDYIYFHALPMQLYKYVIEIPKEKKVVWSSWGYDIYYSSGVFSPICDINLFKPLTKSYLNPRNFTAIGFIKRIIKNIIFPMRTYKQKKIEKEQRRDALTMQTQVLSRIDYCSTVIDTEFDMIMANKSFRAKMIPSPYVLKRDMSSVKDMFFDSAGYILLGNSADPSNNYLDVISLLKKRHIKNKIYMPLAYGNVRNKEYLIEKFGGTDNYIIQDNFISFEEYSSIIKKTCAVIMGHIRQQAMGNITESLFYGHKVFLYEDSVAYKFFVANGVYVYSIERDLFQSEIDTPLEKEKIEYNRNFVLNHWDYDSRVKVMRETLCEKS